MRLDGQRILGVASVASRWPSPRIYRRSAQGSARSARASAVSGAWADSYSREAFHDLSNQFQAVGQVEGFVRRRRHDQHQSVVRIQLLNECKSLGSPALELAGLVVTLTLDLLRFLLPDDRPTVSSDLSDEDQYARRLRVGRVETESLAKFAEV